MYHVNGNTKITIARWENDQFRLAIARYIIDRVGEEDGIDEWLGASNPDGSRAAAWARSWADACNTAHEAGY